MGSAIRVITQSPIYGGVVRWNAYEYVTNPDTGKYKKRARPKSEWVEYVDESLRIVSDDLIERARIFVWRDEVESTLLGPIPAIGRGPFPPKAPDGCGIDNPLSPTSLTQGKSLAYDCSPWSSSRKA